jgi:predicted Rossmann fold flavoprotein
VPTPPATPESAGIAIVGAGAAGLFAAIWAARTCSASGHSRKVLALDGARRLGAKILVAGGGRCNVTHDVVTESAYAGSSRDAIKKVLRRFDVPQVIAFFREQGVELKREETGKLFPTTDDAHTVLNALLNAAADAGVELLHPWRVHSIERTTDHFLIHPEPDEAAAAPPPIAAKKLILCTGGRSLPKTGSDGRGHEIARALGHSITPRVFPALVPLTLPRDHFLCALSGLTLPATLEVRAATGKRLASFTDSTLLTHFGLSGPSVLDISRYWTDAVAEARQQRQPPPQFVINFLPAATPESLEADVIAAAQSRTSGKPATISSVLRDKLPERLLRSLCDHAQRDPATPLTQLSKDSRRALVRAITALPLPITGDRGYTHAEVTAGGIPLREIDLKTMQSRATPNLYLAGEICDVDGRIGGYNFQWAWASGYIAGLSAASREA